MPLPNPRLTYPKMLLHAYTHANKAWTYDCGLHALITMCTFKNVSVLLNKKSHRITLLKFPAHTFEESLFNPVL